MRIDYQGLAREIIEKNQYLTLGTSNPDGTAWVSPVCYSVDSDYNFYFVSLPSSNHAKNSTLNSLVSFAIFDSHQMYGEGVGLQIEGKIKRLESNKEILQAAKIMFTRKYPYRKIFKAFDLALRKFLDDETYSLYKISPSKIWMNDPESEVDMRVEVKL